MMDLILVQALCAWFGRGAEGGRPSGGREEPWRLRDVPAGVLGRRQGRVESPALDSRPKAGASVPALHLPAADGTGPLRKSA